MELPNTFKDFLTLLGSPLFIGVIISVLLVRWAWFVNLATQAKFWLVGLLCLGLPILSQVLLLYIPAPVVTFLEQWWPTVIIGMGIWMSSQIWNQLFGVNGAVNKATNLTLKKPK